MSGFSPLLFIRHLLQVRVAVPDVNLVMAFADVELLVKHVGRVLGQPVPLAAQLPDQALGVGGDQVDHVTQARDLSGTVKDVVLDQSVDSSLVKVSLKLGTRPEVSTIINNLHGCDF